MYMIILLIIMLLMLDIADSHKYLMKKNNIKKMFKFIKQAFISLLLRFNVQLATKCISLYNEACLARRTLNGLNSNELNYHPFIISLDRCNESCTILDDPSGRICVMNVREDANLNEFNMITITNESKTATKYISRDCKC